MLKKFAITAALLLLARGTQAQNPDASTTYPGNEEGNRAVVLTGLRDGMFNFLSEDNRYLSGTLGKEVGFVYDFTERKTTLFENFQMRAYFSPDHYVAADPGENAKPFIHYQGRDIDLEPTISGSSYDNDLSFWNAQPNGNRLVMMGYEYEIDGTDTVTNHVGVLYDGKTGKVQTLLHSYWPRLKPLRHEDNAAYGSRAYGISQDGMVIGGHGTWPTSLCLSTWNPVFWDLSDFEQHDTIYTYAIEDTRFSLSDLTAVSPDGSILVGYNEETQHGLIVYYDRTAKKFTFDTISPLPGWDLLFFSGVDKNDLIVGYCGMHADPITRQAVVYSKEMGLMPMANFLYEYYDIAAPELGTPTHISPDGSIIAGLSYDYGYPEPWFVELKGERILPRARNVKAKAANAGLVVRLDWQRPLGSEATLTGYEIYRDEETAPIAKLDADAVTYTDKTLSDAGVHKYYVMAVYNEGPAGKTASNAVMTIIEGGYFPVQKIDNRVQYNRYASIYWGLPSSEIVAGIAGAATAKNGNGEADLAPVARPVSRTVAEQSGRNDAKSYFNPSFDYIFDVNMLMYDGYCGLPIGDKYYISGWKGTGIRVLNQNNEIETELKPEGMNHAVLSMVYLKDKNQLLCGGVEKVSILDLKNHTVRNNFDAEARHMTYLPDFEFGGETGVLLMGSWNTADFYTLDGKHLGTAGFDFDDLDVSGTAYHDGKLYVSSQSGPNTNEIYTFDVKTRQQIGDPVQVTQDPAVYNLLSLNGEVTSTDDLAYAGGLGICTLEDGTVALVAGYQCSYTQSRLMFLELESAPERRSYNLYRNGEIIAEGLKTRRFYDELNTPGEYKYQVKIITEDKESELSPATTVTIADYGTCLPAKDIKARETNRWVSLNWDVPTTDSAAGLIGFTIFRDGTRLKELWNIDAMVTYTDFSTLELGKPYTYRVETLYGSGCVASDSVQITLTDEGTAMAPFGINFNYKKNAASTADNKVYDVTTTWESPMFEEPLAIGYGTGQMITGAGFNNDELTGYWACIGWDSTDLKLYKDLYLVGMEYMIGDNANSFEAVVYLNNTLAYTESLRRTQAQAWQTMYFKKSIPMNQPEEVVLGYHLTYSPGASPVAIDFSYNKRFYSDIISFDGEAWYSLADNELSASWCIRGLVVRKRDLDEATTDGVVDYAKLGGKIMRLDEAMPMSMSMKPSSTQILSQAPTKAPLTLQGFNLYRQRMDIDGQDEVQLNAELLKTFSYTEAEPLPEGEYDYTVEAVYANATKSATASVTLTDVSTESGLDKLTLTLFPNPASEVVYVNGAFSDLQILDLSGRVLRRLSSASQIEVGNLTPGTYFFRFADQDGRKATYKVVIR